MSLRIQREQHAHLPTPVAPPRRSLASSPGRERQRESQAALSLRHRLGMCLVVRHLISKPLTWRLLHRLEPASRYPAHQQTSLPLPCPVQSEQSLYYASPACQHCVTFAEQLAVLWQSRVRFHRSVQQQQPAPFTGGPTHPRTYLPFHPLHLAAPI